MIRPSGLLWLLRHELRLWARGGYGQGRWLTRAGPRLLLAAIPLVAGIVLAVTLSGREPGPGTTFAGVIGALVIALVVLLVSTASVAVLRTFHDRHDLDLLLAAPIPAARVMAAKAIGVVVTVALPFLVVITPFAVTSALLGNPRWLPALLIVVIDATMATAIAIGLTAGLFATVGPRRARVVVQLIAAVTGGGVFLLSQAQSFAPAATRSAYLLLIRPWPAPLDWPSRAAIGEPLPLLGLVLVAGLAFRAATGIGGRTLARAGDHDDRARAARTSRVRFRSGLTTTIVIKELRLIARDPELIAQVVLRLIYLIPIAAVILRGAGAAAVPAVAATATGFAGLLTSSLAWIVVCAEDAPDLLAAAPRLPAAIARAKLVATCAGPLALVTLAAAGVLRPSPWGAAVTLVMGGVAAVSAALIQSWFGRPARRTAFRRRPAVSFAVGLGEVLLAGAWAGTAGLLARGSPLAVAPALLAGMIVAGAIEARSDAAQRGGAGSGGSGSRSRVSRAASARQPAT